jgi:hypothetical protein
MSELLELALELVFSVADIGWPETKGGRIFWCVILALLGGLIWWDLR